MISKKQENLERYSGMTASHHRKNSFSVFAPFIALAAFFGRLFSHRDAEPFTIEASRQKTPPPDVNRFAGFTFRRVKKVGNFFAYGWVKHDKRVQREAV